MGKPPKSLKIIHPYEERNSPVTSYTLPSKQPLRRDYNHDNYRQPASENSSSEFDYKPHSYKNLNKSQDLLSSQHYRIPYETRTWTQTRSHQYRHHDPYECPSTYSVPLDIDSEMGQYSEPVSNIVSNIPPIGGCGGRCPGFEYVCYYVLQIVFVIGILTGISLCIAGAVLRRSNRGSDLGVLVYIGSLWSCVCSVLLGVQCCVRQEIRARKKPLQTHLPLQRVECRTSLGSS